MKNTGKTFFPLENFSTVVIRAYSKILDKTLARKICPRESKLDLYIIKLPKKIISPLKSSNKKSLPKN